MSRCVILTAAPLPCDDELQAMRSLLLPDDVFYAADNGWRLARRLGVPVSCLIGDFDSGEQPPLSVVTDVVCLPVVKDETDTLAAVRIAQQNGFRRFLILGGLGGRFDHTLANLAVMLSIVKAGGEAVMADGRNEICLLPPGRYSIAPREGYFSLLPYSGEVTGLTVEDAFYCVKGISLTADYPLGVSNTFCGKTAEIAFESGFLLLIFSKD